MRAGRVSVADFEASTELYAKAPLKVAADAEVHLIRFDDLKISFSLITREWLGALLCEAGSDGECSRAVPA